jgi:hypothetical protein
MSNYVNKNIPSIGVVDPDPHQSDKLVDPDQFADDKPKCKENEPI